MPKRCAFLTTSQLSIENPAVDVSVHLIVDRLSRQKSHIQILIWRIMPKITVMSRKMRNLTVYKNCQLHFKVIGFIVWSQSKENQVVEIVANEF